MKWIRTGSGSATLSGTQFQWAVGTPSWDLKVDNGLVLLEVDILIGAEVLREGNAGEILAPLALARRHRVEHGEQGRVDQESGQQATAHENQALCPLAAPLEGDVGHEGVGEEEAGEKADDVGVVVHPGQQAQQQQQAQDQHQLPCTKEEGRSSS